MAFGSFRHKMVSGSKFHPKHTQEASKRFQNEFKTLPRLPKTAQGGPRWPKTPQDAPKMTQVAPKTRLRTSQKWRKIGSIRGCKGILNATPSKPRVLIVLGWF